MLNDAIEDAKAAVIEATKPWWKISNSSNGSGWVSRIESDEAELGLANARLLLVLRDALETLDLAEMTR